MPDVSEEDEGYNELLIEWLTDLRMGAKRCNSKAEFTYLKALKSVKEHKEPLRSGADCRKLKGFGEKICAMIDKKLKEHLGEAYVPPPQPEPAKKRANKNKNTAQPDQPGQQQQQQISSLFSNVRKRVPNIDPLTTAVLSPGIASPMNKISQRAAAAVPSRNRKYVPTQGSSGFAILVALLRYELERGQQLVNKYDLQEMAQRYCTTNLGSSQGNSSMQRFAGWASVKTLLARSLVKRTDARNSYFYLTGKGRRLARNLAKCCSMMKDFAEQYLLNEPDDFSSDSAGEDGADDDVVDLLSDDEGGDAFKKSTTTSSAFSGQPAYRPFIFQPGDYEIILCIDTRERIATNFCSDKNAAFAAALQKQDVRVEIRTLPLGDFVWIAREKSKNSSTNSVDGGSRPFTSMTLEINSSSAPSTSNQSSSDIRRELVLDWIIERKRIDDLAASIKDRRWEEQKFRLLECGIRRPTYLVEYMGKGSRRVEHGGLQPEALEQAMTNCEVDGFDVRRTDCFEETVRYLTFMSRWIEHRFSTLAIMSSANKEALAKTVPGDHHYLPFNEWAINSGKVAVHTAGEMFIKQLLQVKGLSVAKARTIVSRYPTLRALMEAYDRQADLWSKHNLLTDLVPESDVVIASGVCADGSGAGGAKRRFGQVISRKIYEYYGTE